MIGTELLKGQGLGNQLFCYVTARCIAKEHNCEFGILGQEHLPVGPNGEPGLYFMDLYFGNHVERSSFAHTYHEKEERIYTGTSQHDMMLHGCYVAGVDPDMKHVADGTLLYGNMQDESYFSQYRDEIQQWLCVKPKYDDMEYSRENLCIINMRGGEYTGHPELCLRKKYWKDGMKHMKAIRPDMEFMIVTDDVAHANKLFPEIPAYHFDLSKDYATIKNAHYLLLSNSSFAFFPAYTSKTLQYAIAPKYWARHNVSNGYWASEQNIYSLFHYMDRHGKLFSAEECRQELSAYRRKTDNMCKFKRKATGLKLILQKIHCHYIILSAYALRIWPALKRRFGTVVKRGKA